MAVVQVVRRGLVHIGDQRPGLSGWYVRDVQTRGHTPPQVLLAFGAKECSGLRCERLVVTAKSDLAARHGTQPACKLAGISDQVGAHRLALCYFSGLHGLAQGIVEAVAVAVVQGLLCILTHQQLSLCNCTKNG